MAILSIGRDSHFSVGARRPGSLYTTGEKLKGTNKAGNGVYILDRIEAALAEAGGDPQKASAICGVEAREIAKIQRLKASAEAEPENENQKRAIAGRKAALADPVTDDHVRKLAEAFKATGRYMDAGKSLGWSEHRTWAVHRRGLKTGAILRKGGKR